MVADSSTYSRAGVGILVKLSLPAGPHGWRQLCCQPPNIRAISSSKSARRGRVTAQSVAGLVQIYLTGIRIMKMR